MGVDRFYKDSIILTVSNMVTGIIGFVFSIFLSRELGAEGLGLYGLIMPIYSLLLCLACDGVITAISQITAVYRSRRDTRNLNRTMHTVMVFLLLWSTAIALLVFINSRYISLNIIKDSRSLSSVRIICPAIVFVTMSAIFKGYFYGTGQFKIAAVIDVLEKVLRVAVLTVTIALLSKRDVTSTVAAAYLALSIGELISFILLFTSQTIFRSRSTPGVSRPQTRVQLLYDVLKISTPLCLNGVISSILSAVSTLILPRRLVYAGIAYDASLALIGKFSGMALTITLLPLIIVGSISTVLIPDLSLNVSRNNYWAAEARIQQVLKISCLVGTAALVTALTIPDTLGILFYNRNDLEGFIKFAAVSSFFNYIAAPTFGILNGLGKQNANLRNSIIVSVQGLVLIYILTGIPIINIYGYGITLIATSVTALAMNIHDIKKACSLRLPLSEAAAYAVIGFLTYIILAIVKRLIPDSLLVMKAATVILAGFSIVFALSDFSIKKQAEQ